MNYNDIFLADLERETPVSRRVLERVPDGHFDWKPHEKSMPMGYLAMMVATMPEWLGMVVGMDELDIAPKDGPKFNPPPLKTSADLVQALDAAAKKGKAALQGTNDAHLATNWKLLSGGHVDSGDSPARPDPRRRAVALGAPSRAAHGLSEAARRENPVDLRSLRRRKSGLTRARSAAVSCAPSRR